MRSDSETPVDLLVPWHGGSEVSNLEESLQNNSVVGVDINTNKDFWVTFLYGFKMPSGPGLIAFRLRPQAINSGPRAF